MKSYLFWQCFVTTGLLFMTSCMNTAIAKDDKEDVLWKGSKAYEKRVSFFSLKPKEAFELAWKEHERLKHPIFSQEPEFIVGQWYWFGKATKTEIPLAGYYVNGASGKVEYRRSEKVIKAGTKKLPKGAWLKE